MVDDDIKALWDTAVAQYHTTTGIDLLAPATKKAQSVDDVIKLTVDEEDKFKKWRNDGGEIAKFRSLLKASLDPLAAVGGVVAQGASTLFPQSQTILTAVAFLITAAKNISADYDKLEAIFQDLKFYLDALNVIKGHIPESSEIRRCIANILTLTLVQIGLSTKEIKHGRIVRFLKDLKGENEKITAAHKELKAALEQEGRLLQKQNLVYAKDALNTLDGVKEELSNVTHTNKQILSAVTATSKTNDMTIIREHLNPQTVTEYEKLDKKLVPGTATWILEHPAFINWVDCAKPVLWLAGGPGCGKSHLSTSIITHLQQRAAKQEPRGDSVGYYYFLDRDQRFKSVLNALCAVVCQIADGHEAFRVHAALACQHSPKLAMATITTVWKDFIVPAYGPTSSSWLYLVFDGIDEAFREGIEELFDLLRDSLKDGLKAQVLLVGRPDVVPNLGESSLDTIEISSKTNAADITRFIDSKYDEYIKLGKVKGLREDVIATLREKANGMFLWVDLMYQELKDIRQPRRLRLALGSMPTGLLGLYESILTRIENTKGDSKTLAQLKEIFCLVAYSDEPRSILDTNQIIQVVTTDDIFDAEKIVTSTCASLFQFVQTRNVLFNTLVKPVGGPRNSGDPEGEFDELDDWDENCESEQELDEDEADQLEEERQGEIFMHLRHASLGDYIKKPDRKAMGALFNARDVPLHTVLTNLRIVCKGSSVPERLWHYAMDNWLGQLHDLDEKSVSETDTKLIVERIATIFNSEPLGKYIARAKSFESWDDYYGFKFNFGSNTHLQNGSRATIRKWLQKAADLKSISLTPDIGKWIKEVLEHPLKLLAPLSKLCIREWLACDGSPSELRSRFNLAWYCVTSTDLIPAYYGHRFQPRLKTLPRFVGSNRYVFLANVVGANWSFETRLRIARTISYSEDNDVVSTEYQSVIEFARAIGSEKKLKAVYLDYALSQTNLYGMSSYVYDLEPIEAYIALDQSNYRMYTCLGLARFCREDWKGAIEAFAKGLSLNKKDAAVFHGLMSALWVDGDYAGIMQLLESHDLATTGIWIRGIVNREEQQWNLIHAARKTSKVNVLIAIYEHEIANTWAQSSGALEGEAGDDDINMEWYPNFSAGWGNKKNFFSPGTALLRCWLATLQKLCLGRRETALGLWKTAFFRRPELFKLAQEDGDIKSVIGTMSAQFAELLYCKALCPPDGESSVNEKMLYMLERLRQRLNAFEDVCPELDVAMADVTQTSSVLLACLYMRCGRLAEARVLFSEQFARGVECLKGLSDTPSLVTFDNLEILTKILFAVGQIAEAEIMLSLRRAIDKYKCAKVGHDECLSTRAVKARNAPMYTCMICDQADFCEPCYMALCSGNSNTGSIYLCDPEHEFLRSPALGRAVRWIYADDAVSSFEVGERWEEESVSEDTGSEGAGSEDVGPEDIGSVDAGSADAGSADAGSEAQEQRRRIRRHRIRDAGSEGTEEEDREEEDKEEENRDEEETGSEAEDTAEKDAGEEETRGVKFTDWIDTLEKNWNIKMEAFV